jgi:hypothetical protein
VSPRSIVAVAAPATAAAAAAAANAANAANAATTKVVAVAVGFGITIGRGDVARVSKGKSNSIAEVEAAVRLLPLQHFEQCVAGSEVRGCMLARRDIVSVRHMSKTGGDGSAWHAAHTHSTTTTKRGKAGVW